MSVISLFGNEQAIQRANEFTRLGIESVENNNYVLSRRYFEESILVWDSIEGNYTQKAYPFYRLFMLYNTIGDFENSVDYYKKAEVLLLQDENVNSFVLSSFYSNIGFFFSSNSDYERAIDYYTKAKEILENENIYSGVRYFDAIYGIFETLYFQKKFKEAIKMATNSKSSTIEEKNSLIGLVARCYMRLKEFDLALEVIQKQAIEVFDSKKEIEYFLDLIHIYYESSEFEKAEEYLNKVYPLLQKTVSENDPWMIYYYEVYGKLLYSKASKTSDTQMKISWLNESLKIFDIALGLNSRVSPEQIPYLHGEGEFITPVQVADVFEFRTNALESLARVYFEQNDVFTARNYLDLAIQTTEANVNFLHDLRLRFLNEESKIILSENKENVYFKGVELAYELFEETGFDKYFDKMLEFSEKGKSATFLASLNDVKAKKVGGIPDSLIVLEKSTKRILSNLKEMIFNEQNKNEPDSLLLKEWGDRVFNVQNEIDDLTLLFEHKYPKYYNFKYKNEYVSPLDIRTGLKRKQALIEFVIKAPKTETDTGYVYIMLFRKDGNQVYKKTIDSSFSKDIYNVISCISNPSFGIHANEEYHLYKNSAYKLYQSLFDGLDLSHINDLIIIPDGRLSYIPFDALLREPDSSSTINYADLSYLVHDFNITYSYSSTLHYKYFIANNSKANSILAFAPEYDDFEIDLNQAAYRNQGVNRTALRPLPGALEEVESLSRLKNCATFIGEDANELNFKKYASDFDVLHLAMHTILNDSIPMFSKLVFSKTNNEEEDGFLNTQEIYNLNLNARLAVLSACNTGVGQMRKGEGVMSLSRAFLFAGCPSIVMTLWEIEDKSSASLMMSFYDHLFKGNSKSQALRNAKLNHLKHADPLKSHPYFWLGYICVGDSSPIYYNRKALWSNILLVGGIIILLYFTMEFVKKCLK